MRKYNLSQSQVLQETSQVLNKVLDLIIVHFF